MIPSMSRGSDALVSGSDEIQFHLRGGDLVRIIRSGRGGSDRFVK